jgi:hypothetical protein
MGVTGHELRAREPKFVNSGSKKEIVCVNANRGHGVHSILRAFMNPGPVISRTGGSIVKLIILHIGVRATNVRSPLLPWCAADGFLVDMAPLCLGSGGRITIPQTLHHSSSSGSRPALCQERIILASSLAALHTPHDPVLPPTPPPALTEGSMRSMMGRRNTDITRKKQHTKAYASETFRTWVTPASVAQSMNEYLT